MTVPTDDPFVSNEPAAEAPDFELQEPPRRRRRLNGADDMGDTDAHGRSVKSLWWGSDSEAGHPPAEGAGSLEGPDDVRLGAAAPPLAEAHLGRVPDRPPPQIEQVGDHRRVGALELGAISQIQPPEAARRVGAGSEEAPGRQSAGEPDAQRAAQSEQTETAAAARSIVAAIDEELLIGGAGGVSEGAARNARDQQQPDWPRMPGPPAGGPARQMGHAAQPERRRGRAGGRHEIGHEGHADRHGAPEAAHGAGGHGEAAAGPLLRAEPATPVWHERAAAVHPATIFVGFSRFWFQAETGKTEV